MKLKFSNQKKSEVDLLIQNKNLFVRVIRRRKRLQLPVRMALKRQCFQI